MKTPDKVSTAKAVQYKSESQSFANLGTETHHEFEGISSDNDDLPAVPNMEWESWLTRSDGIESLTWLGADWSNGSK